MDLPPRPSDESVIQPESELQGSAAGQWLTAGGEIAALEHEPAAAEWRGCVRAEAAHGSIGDALVDHAVESAALVAEASLAGAQRPEVLGRLRNHAAKEACARGLGVSAWMEATAQG